MHNKGLVVPTTLNQPPAAPNQPRKSQRKIAMAQTTLQATILQQLGVLQMENKGIAQIHQHQGVLNKTVQLFFLQFKSS